MVVLVERERQEGEEEQRHDLRFWELRFWEWQQVTLHQVRKLALHGVRCALDGECVGGR